MKPLDALDLAVLNGYIEKHSLVAVLEALDTLCERRRDECVKNGQGYKAQQWNRAAEFIAEAHVNLAL